MRVPTIKGKPIVTHEVHVTARLVIMWRFISSGPSIMEVIIDFRFSHPRVDDLGTARSDGNLGSAP